jgi:hypothetical protein
LENPTQPSRLIGRVEYASNHRIVPSAIKDEESIVVVDEADVAEAQHDVLATQAHQSLSPRERRFRILFLTVHRKVRMRSSYR